MRLIPSIFLIFSLLTSPLALSAPAKEKSIELHWAAIQAPDRDARTRLLEEGFSIENIKDDTSYGFAPLYIIEKLQKAGFKVQSHFPAKDIKGLDFPAKDAIYHNYSELTKELDDLAATYPKLVHKFSIGKSVEGREIWGVRISSQAKDGLTASSLPGIVFLGGHHAREHLSVEVPLLLARYLAESRDPQVISLVDNRDIFIIPMINPDGAEFDISTGSYQMWRKNRNRNPGSSCMGVDLNRNYGYQWGTGGSSKDPCADTFMGPKPFSEPESQAVKTFLENHLNLKTLLTFHTYSELILYPWGHTKEDIRNRADLTAYLKMAQTMANWNGYKHEPTHQLYIASGDTTDWAYGTLGIFSFTFELSPQNSWGGGGFYPGPEEIQHSFQVNIKPALYLIDLADNPYRSVSAPETTIFYGQ